VRAGAAAAVAPRLRRPERGRRARTGRVGSTRPGGPRRTRRGSGSRQNQTQQPLWRNTSLGGPENLYKGCTCITSRNAESCVVDRSPNRTALTLVQLHPEKSVDGGTYQGGRTGVGTTLRKRGVGPGVDGGQGGGGIEVVGQVCAHGGQDRGGVG